QVAMYLLLRYVIAALDIFSYDLARRVGKLIGRIMYVLDTKHRKIAAKNIERAEGMPKRTREIHRLVRRVYEHFAVGAIETLLIPRMMARGDLDRIVKLENFHLLDEALAKGRGVIVVLAHMGNWEVAGLAVSRKGYDLSSIARPIENPFMDAYVNRLRKSTGQEIIPKHRAVRSMAESLKANKILAILADQNARKNGVFVPFFGRPASTVRSPALMALKYGAPIYAVNLFRSGRNEYRCIMTPEIPTPKAGDREKVIEKITADVTARLEGFIREHPEQWMWLHARWKTKPANGTPGDEGEEELASHPAGSQPEPGPS
ncbi:MAG TPA: lysophospholipid acyltransferase family protein, partial [Planctomycetota bacterium]|nr:lysophospholipid acyltransferase family protein [Planctomycetota bacterium]